MKITKENFISFLTLKSFQEIKIADSYMSVDRYLQGKNYLEKKDKDFHLIKYGNVELTLNKNREISLIHFELSEYINKKVYDFKINKLDDIISLIKSSEIKIDKQLQNQLILKNNTRLFFNEVKLLTDIYFF